MNYRKILVAVFLLTDIVLVSFFVAGERSAQRENAANMLRGGMNECLRSSKSNSCYQNLAVTLASRFSIPVIVETVIENEGYEGVFEGCHELLHFVGREAHGYFQGVGEALAAGNTACFAGYYHGVLEEYLIQEKLPFHDPNALKDIARNTSGFCRDLKNLSLPLKNYYECLHGLGHAFMFITDYELPLALTLCDVMDLQNDANWCYSGVFMENSTSSTVSGNKDHVSKYIKEDDLFYPCSILEEKYLHSCYMLQGSYFLDVAGGDWEAAVRLCEEIPSPYNLACINMIGQSQVNSTQNAEGMRQNCLSLAVTSHRDTCIAGTVGALGERFEKDAPQRAIEFCSGFAAHEKEVCYQQLFHLLPMWRKNSSAIKPICLSIPEEKYQTRCADNIR